MPGNRKPKGKPERVTPVLARAAIEQVQKQVKPSVNVLYTHYIRLNYSATGKLAPGCDARDLMAWYSIHMPEEFAAVGGGAK